MNDPPKIVIQEKVMVARLNCSFSFGRVTDKIITDEVSRNKRAKGVVVRKELFPGPSGKYLRELQATLAQFYGYHTKVTMDSLNDGERLLPVIFYPDYMREYGVYQVMVPEAYQEFEDHYDESVKLAPGELNDAFNPTDYPPKEDMRRRLNFHLRTYALPTATPLLNALGESIQADHDSYVEDAMKAALTDVNKRVKESLQRMIDVLANPKGRVHDSMMESIKELVSFIPSFNITADDSLNLLAEEVTARLIVDPDDLRKDPVIRQQTAEAAFEILRRMG